MTMMDAGATPQPATSLAQQLQAIAMADNLADQLDEGVRGDLANQVLDHFEIDEASMQEWQTKMDKALDLAMMVKEDRTYPWVDASNIRYPLITSAALQYNARAYPAIVPGTDVVKAQVHGSDPNNQKANRAERVATFMSWQLKVDSREWERGTDQLLMQLPIVGCAYRKLWWDPALGKLRSQVRLPGKHVVVNNNVTSLGHAPRISDQIKLYPHQIETNMRSGFFREFDYNVSGQDHQEPQEFIEQLCRFDLDGDEYDEPYIVTVHKDTKEVVRVVAAYDMDTVRVQGNMLVSADPVTYFVHYNFMPAMDGGFHGMGMGVLLGDISETINSTLNMLMDSGHLSSLGGGFIGAQNFRVKGGVNRVKPGEYKMLNFAGDDIRRGIVPLDFPGPSPVLFSVLGMLMDAGREIASVNDIMTGDSGNANLPVGTVMALIEQGHQVFTASYKRIYRALQDEFEIVARLNQKHVTPEQYNMLLDAEPIMGPNGQPVPQMHDPKEDFNFSDMDITPVADPQSVTSMQKMGRAQFVYQLALDGMLDRGEAMRRVLESAQIDNIDALIPQPDPMAEIMAAAQQELMVLEIRTKEAELDEIIAKTMKDMAAAEKDAAEVDLMPMRARIDQMKAMKEVLSERREQINAGLSGGMAGAAGNANASGGNPQGDGNQQGAAAIATLAGGAM